MSPLAAQLKKMALFDPLREHLIDADAITTVASVVAKCPISETAAAHIASFLSNMTIFTFKHHPGSAKVRLLQAAGILFHLSGFLKAKNSTNRPLTFAHFKPECPNSIMAAWLPHTTRGAFSRTV
jgi:hypothetical protein